MKNKKSKAYKEQLNVWLGSLMLLLYGSKLDNEQLDLGLLSQAHFGNHVKFGYLHKAKFKTSLVATGLLIIAVAWFLASTNLSTYNINGQKVSTSLSNSALINKVGDVAGSYRLYIVYPDKTLKKYSLKQVGLSVNKKQSINSLLAEKNSLGNRLVWWRPIKAKIALSKNDAIFNNFIATSTQIIVEPSVDASLTITNGQINISGAVSGKEYGLVNSSADLLHVASTLSSNKIKLRTLAVKPALTDVLLEPYKAQLASVINQPITFSIGDQVIKPSTAQISNWLDITPDDKSKKVNISVNSGKVLAYMQSIASPLTKPAKAQVMMSSSDGTTQLLVPGQNGVVVSGESSIATNVANALLKGEGINQSLSVSYKPFETITAGDYPKWIEVDLTNKRIYAYEHSNLVNTYLVTAGAPKTPTVTGQYAIYSKYVSQNMTGENVDGSSYFQPHVPWINYFYKDYAIHGNYWRPLSYFGNVNSSHGCVGLIDDQAAWVYNWAPVGTPVITHY